MRFVAAMLFLTAVFAPIEQSTPIHGDGKWIYRTSMDQMTDIVTHTLYLEADAPSDGDDGTKRPFLYMSCDTGRPRKLLIHVGLTPNVANPMFRFDQEAATTDRWHIAGTAYYKDDSLTPPKGVVLKPGSDEEKLLNSFGGADRFVKSMSEHSRLLIRTSSASSTVVTASFDLSGLAKNLETFKCPAAEASTK